MGSKLSKNWMSFNLRGNLSNASPEGCLKLFLLEFFKSALGKNIVDILTLSEFALEQNYPNPFNPTTTFKYSIPQTSKVVIKVYDILGNEIATLMDEEKPVGTCVLTWNAANLPSGVYFYQLRAGSFVETKKMLLLK